MFSEGHNNGIVKGIDRTRQNIVDSHPYFKAVLVGPPPVDTPTWIRNATLRSGSILREGRELTIFRLVRSIGIPSTIPLCA